MKNFKISVLFFTVFLTHFYFSVDSSNADERKEVEERLSSMLAQYISVNHELVSTLSASFEGCKIKLTREYTRNRCKKTTSYNVSFQKYENIIDLNWIELRPEDVKVRQVAKTERKREAAVLEYQIANSMKDDFSKVKRLASTILNQEYDAHPADVSTRLEKLELRYQKELNFAHYEGLQTITHFCQGTILVRPAQDITLHMRVSPDDEKRFKSTLYSYSKKYC